MADDILKIGAEFDVSQIVAGSEQAAVAMDNLGTVIARQAATFEKQGLTVEETAQALEQLGYSSSEVAAALGVQTEATEAATAATGRFGSAMGEARIAAGALTGSTGMIAGGMARMVASSEALAPLLMAAFPVFGALALVDILKSVYEAFGNVANQVTGYTKEVQKAEQADIKFSTEAMGHAQTLEEAEAKLHSTLVELGNAGKETFTEKWGRAAQDAMEKTSSLWGPLEGLVVLYRTLDSAESSAADQAVKLAASQRSLFMEKAEKSLDINREAVKLIDERVAAENAGLPASDARIRSIQNEMTALSDKQKVEEQIAVFEAGSKVLKEGGGNAVLAEQSARANVDEEYYYKRIQLEGELSAAQAEASVRETERADRSIENWKRVLAERQKDAEFYKDLDAQEAAFFAESQDKDVKKAADAAVKKLEADVKYHEEANRLAEESALKNISYQEQAVSRTSQLEIAKRVGPSESELQRGKITEQVGQQELAALENLENQKLEIIKNYIEQEKAILLGGETEQQFAVTASPQQLTDLQKLNAQLEQAEQEHVAKMAQYTLQATNDAKKASDEQMQAYMKGFQGINQGFENLTDQILRGNLTVEQAFVRMGANMLLSLINNLEKMVLQFLEHELMMTIIHTTQTQAQVAQSASASAQTKAISSTSALSEVGHAAAVAAAKAYSALAGVPVIGPVLGAAAAAGTFAAVLAFGALAGAEQGAEIDYDTPLFVHAGETVAPKPLSAEMHNLVPNIQKFNSAMATAPAGAASGGGSHSMTSNSSFNISALDPQSFMHFAERNQRTLTQAARGFARNGGAAKRIGTRI